MILFPAWRTGGSAAELKARFAQIEPGLLRYPAIDTFQFKKKVADFLAET